MIGAVAGEILYQFETLAKPMGQKNPFVLCLDILEGKYMNSF